MEMTFEMMNTNTITQVRAVGLRDGLAVQRTDCSCRGPGSISQHPHGGSRPLGNPMPSIDLSGHCAHMERRHTCRASSCTCKIAKSKKKQRDGKQADQEGKLVDPVSRKCSVHSLAMSSDPSPFSEVFQLLAKELVKNEKVL